MKSHHSFSIQKIADALAEEGHKTLDAQANALGLPRSTTWHILRANHKKSGLSAAIVKRMLASGARVRIWDRDQKLLQQTLSSLTGPVEQAPWGSVGEINSFIFCN